MKFNVTYEVVTYESAEDGEAAESGFYAEDISLREAIALVGYCEDCGTWFAEADGDTDYQTGAVTYRSLHPPRTITKSSYGRIKRLLNRR